MLNDYVEDEDKSFIEKEEANTNLNNLEFRIQGSKTIDEIKKEVSIFLEKNDIPLEIEKGLEKICDDFNENTDVYQASIYLENFMKEYLSNKEKKHQENSDTVQEIKEDVVEEIKKELDDVGITVSGSSDLLVDSIQEEADIYKLKDNVDRTTEYFEERNQIVPEENKTLVEIPSDEIADILESPTDEVLLTNVLTEEEKQNNNIDNQVEVKEDGSIIVQGDATNNDSMNFAAMMTNALVASNDDYGLDEKLDMKFIKDQEHESTFKIIYGDFPILKQPNSTIDPTVASKIGSLTANYQSQVSYMQLLGAKSPELMTALTLIQEQLLNEKGAFQMAVKNGGKQHEMMFAVDENYNHVSTAFHESGAMVSHDAMEHSIIRVNNTSPGEQLMVLSTTLDNLRQKKIESSLVNQNVYQKQLVYPNQMNEAANVHKTFLIVVLVAEMLLLLVGSYFLFM